MNLDQDKPLFDMFNPDEDKKIEEDPFSDM